MSDPWKPYDQAKKPKKDDPIVPEPRHYGLLLTGFCLCLLLFARRRNINNTKENNETI
jgi:hypothetical protein